MTKFNGKVTIFLVDFPPKMYPCVTMSPERQWQHV